MTRYEVVVRSFMYMLKTATRLKRYLLATQQVCLLNEMTQQEESHFVQDTVVIQTLALSGKQSIGVATNGVVVQR